MPSMTSVLSANRRRPFSTCLSGSVPCSSTGLRRRVWRNPARRLPISAPAVAPSFQDTSHLLFYTPGSAKAKRRGLKLRVKSSRDMMSNLMLSAEEAERCSSPRAPGLEVLADIAEDLATLSQEMANASSSSSSSSSSSEEDCGMKAAKKQEKKEMKAARKLEKMEGKVRKRRALEQDMAARATPDSQRCTTVMERVPAMADCATAMEESSAAFDNTMTVMPVRGEPVVMKMPQPLSRRDMDATADSAPNRTQLLVCQGSACRKRGSEALMASLSQSAESIGMDVLPCKCLGMCKTGPHIKARMQDPRAAEM